MEKRWKPCCILTLRIILDPLRSFQCYRFLWKIFPVRKFGCAQFPHTLIPCNGDKPQRHLLIRFPAMKILALITTSNHQLWPQGLNMITSPCFRILSLLWRAYLSLGPENLFTPGLETVDFKPFWHVIFTHVYNCVSVKHYKKHT